MSRGGGRYPEAPREARRSAPLVPGDLEGLPDAVRAALARSEAWAGGRAALRWPTARGVPFERMGGDRGAVQAAEPPILHPAWLGPDGVGKR